MDKLQEELDSGELEQMLNVGFAWSFHTQMSS